MSWKDKLDEALKAIKSAAESDSVKNFANKARQTAVALASKAREGALNAAEAFVEANSDPAALKVRFLNADLSIVSPSEGIEITRPNAGTLVISDGTGNGLVINASAEKPYVAETIGTVSRLAANTFDLGSEDGINVVVLRE